MTKSLLKKCVKIYIIKLNDLIKLFLDNWIEIKDEFEF